MIFLILLCFFSLILILVIVLLKLITFHLKFFFLSFTPFCIIFISLGPSHQEKKVWD